MEQDKPVDPAPAPPDHEASYEPPAVESVLTADDLAREVQYAGSGTVTVLGPDA